MALGCLGLVFIEVLSGLYIEVEFEKLFFFLLCQLPNLDVSPDLFFFFKDAIFVYFPDHKSESHSQ